MQLVQGVRQGTSSGRATSLGIAGVDAPRPPWLSMPTRSEERVCDATAQVPLPLFSSTPWFRVLCRRPTSCEPPIAERGKPAKQAVQRSVNGSAVPAPEEFMHLGGADILK